MNSILVAQLATETKRPRATPLRTKETMHPNDPRHPRNLARASRARETHHPNTASALSAGAHHAAHPNAYATASEAAAPFPGVHAAHPNAYATASEAAAPFPGVHAAHRAPEAAAPSPGAHPAYQNWVRASSAHEAAAATNGSLFTQQHSSPRADSLFAQHSSPRVGGSLFVQSTFPGASPLLQPREARAFNDITSQPIPGVASPAPAHISAVLAMLSPELRAAAESELVGRANTAMPAAFQSPPPMQPSPPPPLAPGPSGLFGANLCMTDIRVSDLKRPAQSMTTGHEERENFEPVSKKVKPSCPENRGHVSSGAASSPSKDLNDDGNNSYDDLYGDLGDDVFGGFGSSLKLSPSTHIQDDSNHDGSNNNGFSDERRDENDSSRLIVSGVGAPSTRNQEYVNNHDSSGSGRSGERRDENESHRLIGIADGAVTVHQDEVTCDPYELASVGDLSDENTRRVFLDQFPPVPTHMPDADLDAQLEPITCNDKKVEVQKIRKNPPPKHYDTKLEYGLRKLECLTLGRLLTGRYGGVTGGSANENKWYRHPVTSFRMWLRVDKRGSQTLWTYRNGKWKRNVYKELFPAPAYGIYHRLWQDHDFWKEHFGPKGDPRTNKEAFKPVVCSIVSAGVGDDELNECLDAFWKDPQRTALQQKYSDADPHTAKPRSKKKTGKERPQFSKEEQQLLQQNRESLALAQRPTINVASGGMYSSGAVSVASGGIMGVVNNYYSAPPTGSAVAPAPPSSEPETRSV